MTSSDLSFLVNVSLLQKGLLACVIEQYSSAVWKVNVNPDLQILKVRKLWSTEWKCNFLHKLDLSLTSRCM